MVSCGAMSARVEDIELSSTKARVAGAAGKRWCVACQSVGISSRG